MMNIVMILALSLLIVWPDTSNAYVDPGTGSILIQGIIGAIAAIGVTLKLYWHRIVRVIRPGSADKQKADDTQPKDLSE